MSEVLVSGEDYCTACQGPCSNDDPADYFHMYADWSALAEAWQDKGADPNDVWSFMASTLLAIARENGVEWQQVHDTLKNAWEKADRILRMEGPHGR